MTKDLAAITDGGKDAPFPDGLHINGQVSNTVFNADQGHDLFSA